MGPVQVHKQKTWSETNKIRKEERRKRKEQSLKKKLESKNLQEHAALNLPNDCKSNEASKILRTVSIAVPGSVLETAQSQELRAYLCGQIARASCIFQVDEVVVFDDYADEAVAQKASLEDNYGVKNIRQSCVQLGRILQYLECPQYLRKQFFPIHSDLRFCGLINPLNAPHHLDKNDNFEFREGVVLNKPVKPGNGSIVNVGLLKEVHVDKLLTPGLRCTVKLLPEQQTFKKLKGVIVSPSLPRTETGVYWGYTIRLANSLAKVLSQCPHKSGYDLIIGTSDKGSSVDEFECPPFTHALIVFGGVQGLEMAIENDTDLDVDDPKSVFDYYLNVLPSQGSRTIRTEEAILVTLSVLRSKMSSTN